jgi:hypothetical protein
MEAASTGATAQNGWRRDLTLLLVLVVLATALRTWAIRHTVVTARDSIGFIRYALQLEKDPARALRENRQHPGYAVAVLAMSWPVRAVLGDQECRSWQLSAQFVSAISSVLLIFPMYFLGLAFFDRRAAFWGTAVFQCLPAVHRVMSDGLSDTLYLLLASSVLLLAVWSFRRRSALGFILCGVGGGLAYLTRPEGALLVAVIGLVLLLSQKASDWRFTLVSGTGMALTTIVVISPFVWTTGRLTGKTTSNILLGQEQPTETSQLVTAGPLLAVWSPDFTGLGLSSRPWWGLHALVTETGRGFNYGLLAPALLALWWFGSLFRREPGPWVIWGVCALQFLILWRMASVVGYVSERHTLLFVLCGSLWAIAFLIAVAERLLQRWALSPKLQRALVVALPVLAAVTGLPSGLQPLHANRAPHRYAGQWLAEHSQPADIIVDPFCWAHFYAGRVFSEGMPVPPPTSAILHYIVLDNTVNHHSRLPQLSTALRLAEHGALVYFWPSQGPPEKAKIQVFAVDKP